MKLTGQANDDTAVNHRLRTSVNSRSVSASFIQYALDATNTCGAQVSQVVRKASK